MGWGAARPLCLYFTSPAVPGVTLGGGGKKQGAEEAGMTVSVPTPGPPQLQTSASPRSCILTFSAWASACLFAEVSYSSGRGRWVGRCRETLLQFSLAWAWSREPGGLCVGIGNPGSGGAQVGQAAWEKGAREPASAAH